MLRNISPPIAHVIRVPDQYNHAVVKESLHACTSDSRLFHTLSRTLQIFDRCSEFGCLIDLTRLDKEREITILSARKVQRDKMLTWITEVAESTMRRRTAPLFALGQAAPVAPAPSPAENATVRALVTMGYDAGRVLRAVASLSDKSNVEAAVVEVERIAGDAVESLMAAVGSKPDYKSELNQLAMATRRKVHYSTMPLADGSGHAVFLSTVIVAPEGSVSAAGKAAGKTLAEQAAARQALVELEKKLSLSAARRDEPPDAFVCPITFEVMIDPVIASDGYTYERHAIVHWVHKKRKKTSPTTNADLESFGLIPNYNLRSQISEWQQGKRA